MHIGLESSGQVGLAKRKETEDSWITLFALCKVSAWAGRSKLTPASSLPARVGTLSGPWLLPGSDEGKANSHEAGFVPGICRAAVGSKAAGLIAKFA